VLSNFQLLQSSSSVSAKAVAVEVFWVLNEPKIASVLVRRTTQPPHYVCIIVAAWVHSFTYMVQIYWDGVLGSTRCDTQTQRGISPSVFYPQRDMLLSWLGTQVGTHLLAVRSILFGRRVSLRPEGALQTRRFDSTRCQ
jgi:hypothetical protein